MSIPFNLFIFCRYNRGGQARTTTGGECRMVDESNPYFTEHVGIRYR